MRRDKVLPLFLGLFLVLGLTGIALANGTITGHVYQSNGSTALNNEIVLAYPASSYDRQTEYHVTTGVDGSYALPVPAGDWKVQAGGATSYAPEYYNNKTFFNQADAVHVTENLTTPSIDFTLEPGATISGTLTDTNGVPLSNVYVDFAKKTQYHSEFSKSTNTDANGNFSFQGLPSGIVELEAEPVLSSGYAFTQKYIYLNTGETKTGVNLKAKNGFLIQGYVKDTSGAGIASVHLFADGADPANFARASTDSNGHYQMRVPNGKYGIAVDNGDKGYFSLTKFQTITGDTVLEDFKAYTTAQLDASKIIGNVDNSGSHSVTFSFFIVAFQAGIMPNATIDDWGNYIADGEADAPASGGNYTLLVPPDPSIEPPDLLYDVSLAVSDETDSGIWSWTGRGRFLNVPPGAAAKNFTYNSAGAELTGTVKYDGVPALLARVFLTNTEGNFFAGMTETDEFGTYKLNNVPAGDYTVQAKNSEGVKTGKVSVIVTGTETVTKNISYASIPPMVTGDINGDGIDELVVNFGESYGIWIRYADSSWSQLHPLSPKSMVAAKDYGDAEEKEDLVIDFGDPYGIWIYYNSSEWRQLHNLSAEQIVTADLDRNGQKDIIVDFGPQYGIWIYYNNSTWAQLHNISPKSMVEADLDDDRRPDLIVDFGPQYGIWVYYNNSTWTQLHNLSADSIVANDLDLDPDSHEDIVVDFGDAYGIWIYYNNSTWVQLHSLSPVSMALVGHDNGLHDIIIDFGPSYGIWGYYDNSTWAQIHNLSADSIVTGELNGNSNGEVIIDFGEQYGIWGYYDNSSWQQIHNLSP